MGLCITSSQIPRGNLKKLGGGKMAPLLDISLNLVIMNSKTALFARMPQGMERIF